ncbi:sugar phosphate permease [Thermoplasmatales archaeon SCGC AB-539-N05]|nr:sugar phosphate permease [Thermoplasmatales archaeon SCGC AB-539-N05]ENO12014.1 sugar phosphate permease [Thermoplasmatales archaeon SCGC AB-539-C06]
MKINWNFWNIWSSYSIFYFGKVNLSIVIPALLITYKDLNLYDFGLVSMGFMGAYAVGQFLHGQISERMNPYKYIVGGLILSGIANFFMGFLGMFFVMLLMLETCDGFFQSMGWSSTVRANSELYENDKERDRSSTILGCSYQFGNSMAWFVSAFAVAWWGWQAGFWVASAFLISRGILLYLTRPKEEFKPKQTVKKQVKTTFSFPIVMSGLSLMLLNMVRYGVMTWLFTYYVFAGNFGIADFGTVSLKIVFIPIAGIIGTLIYNKVPWKKDLTSIAFLAAMGVTWFLFPYTDGLTATVLVLASSAFLYGPHVFLVTTCPTRFKEQNVVASSTGFIDGMGYVGTTAIMLVVPYLVLETTGAWNNVFLLWALISFAASAFVAITYFGHFKNNQGDKNGSITV